MLLAGIDEAGYGPPLGPLVVGSAAFRLDHPDDAPPPDLWDRLANVVRRSGARAGREPDERLLVGDSKQLYSTERGVATLERSVLAFAGATRDGRAPESAAALLEALLDAEARAALAALPWYDSDGETFPLATHADELAATSVRLTAGLEETGVMLVRLAAGLLTAETFNRSLAQTQNKATTLWELVAAHLVALRRLATGRGERLVVVVDRLGGRKDYVGLLADAFPASLPLEVQEGAPVEAASETSSYELVGDGAPTLITFRVRADSTAFPVALASMTAKYLRELLMARFNRWWGARDAALAPTAGYPEDAARWLAATASLRARLGVADERLVRQR